MIAHYIVIKTSILSKIEYTVLTLVFIFEVVTMHPYATPISCLCDRIYEPTIDVPRACTVQYLNTTVFHVCFKAKISKCIYIKNKFQNINKLKNCQYLLQFSIFFTKRI